MSPQNLTPERLSDSEATLRLVDALLNELHDGDPGVNGTRARVGELLNELSDRPSGLSSLPNLLLRSFVEIQGVIETLRSNRTLLRRVALERIQRTSEKLREVSSTTELAASNILDGLDRAVQLTETLSIDPESAGDRAALLDELHHIMGYLQFQDITAQQLDYASGVLADVEGRLARVAELFNIGLHEDEDDDADDQEEIEIVGAFDPAATIECAEGRQALADEIFK